MQPIEREQSNFNELPTSLDDDDFDITAVLKQEDDPAPAAAAIAAITPATKTAGGAPVKKLQQQAVARPGDSGQESEITPSAAASTATINPGQMLKNRFVLEEMLDRGGIGVVYKARDLLRQSADAGSEWIALKVLREDFRAEPQLLKSLQREALQSQGLSHPNIVRVYDFHQDGETPFLTMELLDGELLRTVLAKYRPSTMPKERALRIIGGMCSGLAHAHAHGIVHGDFKPGNVFLTARDEAKILDFGLVHAAPAAAGQPGNALLVVSPAYASCNRLEGGAPALSDDVYSLSCVIYELLAGYHPFDRKSALIVRDQELRPKRINGLTSLQWRTLATGLQPLREDRSTEVHDLQAAFAAQATQPVVTRQGSILRGMAASVSGLLLLALLLFAMALLGLQPVPAKYVRLAQESQLARLLQPVLDWPRDGSSETETITPTQHTGNGDTGSAVAATETAMLPPGRETTAAAAGSPAGNVTVPPATDKSLRLPAGPVASAAGREADSSDVLAPAESIDVAAAAPIAGTPSFHLGAPVYYVNESAVALTVQINRQGDLATPASVEWTIFPGSAEPQFDYAAPGERLLRFAPGDTTKTIFIPIVADTVAEREETFQLALRSPGGNVVLAEPITATVTIIDDDTWVPLGNSQ